MIGVRDAYTRRGGAVGGTFEIVIVDSRSAEVRKARASFAIERIMKTLRNNILGTRET